MSNIRIAAASAGQRDKAIEAIVISFAANATCRWIWPDLSQYMRAMPVLVEAIAGDAFRNGSAFVDADVRGVALWLAPDATQDENAVGALIEKTVEKERLRDIEEFFRQLDAFHPHDEKCWYLPFLAVEPFGQNMGLGGTLMRYALGRNDADGLASYLESSDPRNLTLYERLGFEKLGRIQVGAFDAVHPMIRRP